MGFEPLGGMKVWAKKRSATQLAIDHAMDTNFKFYLYRVSIKERLRRRTQQVDPTSRKQSCNSNQLVDASDSWA